MSIVGQIGEADRRLTMAVNGCHAEWCDDIFYVYSKMEVWIPFFLVLVGVIWYERGWKRVVEVILWAGLAVLLSDQICNIFKYTVCRLRPTHEPLLEGMVHTVRGYIGGEYGFCSSHAANTAAIGVMTGVVVRRRRYWAVMVSYVILSCWSRIYLGVHYIGDVVCGVMVGVMVSVVIYKILKRGRWREEGWGIRERGVKSLVYSYIVTCIGIVLWSMWG